MNKRRRARELALRTLCAEEMSGSAVESLIDNMIVEGEEEEKTKQFAMELTRSSVTHKGVCDKMIQNKAQNWDFDRIAVLDKLIMRIAICEFLHFADIPPKVTIDEAIEVAKRYSTEKSGLFINGILDSILVDLKKSEKMKKSGRGLT
jgi:N utilization substance protein B